jgi:hypothetical protein
LYIIRKEVESLGLKIDTDGAYVMSETSAEESDKVKMFDKFIPDLRKLLARSAGKKPI